MSLADAWPWPDGFERILRSYCPLAEETERIDPATPLALLGLDSLAMLGFIVDLEDAFTILVPDTMLTDEVFASPASLWEAIRTLLPQP
ncbi:phosphopantetheine-binding protein [Micromonospora tulbaghiae]|uniref:phosphopantetheine-binding protein n=1 Tax=Micromonospora tulbaghiae TaxID=479978 RepID=UPI0034034F36